MMIKAMTVGDILDTTFTLYKKNYKGYWTLAAMGVVPAAMVSILFMILFPVNSFAEFDLFFFEPTVLMGSLLSGFLSFVIQTVMYAGMIKYVSEHINDREMEAKDAFMFGLRKFIVVFLGGLLVGLAFILGFIALIIPALYLGVLFALYVHAIIIEDASPWDSLMRSRKLISGSWWRSLGIFILIGVLSAIISLLATAPLEIFSGAFFFWDPYLQGLINILYNIPVSIIVTPISAIAYTLYYYDLRVRKENLDLDVMIDQLTQQNPQDELR
jgi:hypothetical protein